MGDVRRGRIEHVLYANRPHYEALGRHCDLLRVARVNFAAIPRFPGSSTASGRFRRMPTRTMRTPFALRTMWAKVVFHGPCDIDDGTEFPTLLGLGLGGFACWLQGADAPLLGKLVAVNDCIA